MVMNILVIGCGSIGQRHIRNLRSLGVKYFALLVPMPECVEQIAQLYKGDYASECSERDKCST